MKASIKRMEMFTTNFNVLKNKAKQTAAAAIKQPQCMAPIETF